MSSLPKIKMPRSSCTVCRIAAFVAIALVVLVLIWAAVIWTQKEAWSGLAGQMSNLPKQASPPVACCQASTCCSSAPALPAFGFIDGWPLLVLVTLGIFFVLLVVITVFVLTALGLPVGALTQIGPLLQLIAQLLPHAKNFAVALRKTADALDAGKDAAHLVSAAVKTASTNINEAAGALNNLHVPWTKWVLRQAVGPLYYVKVEPGDPPAFFSAVVTDLQETGTELDTAAQKLTDLEKGLEGAATSLRQAANVVDPP